MVADPAVGHDESDDGVSARVGRSVHGALAAIDLATGRDSGGRPAEAVARAAARTNGATAHADDVTSMVAALLANPTLERAARGRHWQELAVSVPLGSDGVVEAVVDLLYEDAARGLVVVEVKTGRRPDPAGAGTRPPDALQVATYAAAVEASTGRTVARAVVLEVSGTSCHEAVIAGDELARLKEQAMDRARRLVGVAPTADRSP